MELDNLTRVKSHYLKLQYGIFSKLEQFSIDSRCIKLMWHLQDKVWENYNKVIDMLADNDNWNYTEFNVLFGHLHFLITTLIYREEKILYPVAAKRIPKAVQRFLLSETETYGILE